MAHYISTVNTTDVVQEVAKLTICYIVLLYMISMMGVISTTVVYVKKHGVRGDDLMELLMKWIVKMKSICMLTSAKGNHLYVSCKKLLVQVVDRISYAYEILSTPRPVKVCH